MDDHTTPIAWTKDALEFIASINRGKSQTSALTYRLGGMPMTSSREAAIRQRWNKADQLFVKTGFRRMKKAILLARQDRLHPDPQVAAAALEWAMIVTSIERRPAQLDQSRWRRVGAIFLAVASLGSIDLYTAWLRERSLRRDAAEIMRASRSSQLPGT